MLNLNIVKCCQPLTSLGNGLNMLPMTYHGYRYVEDDDDGWQHDDVLFISRSIKPARRYPISTFHILIEI